jgi:retron-type reverse transcriptase
MDFEMHLEDNLFSLFIELKNCTYKHSNYTFFQVFDNKKRDIFKAEVRDRVVHQVVYEYLLAHFGESFISDSYASRISKGQYRAINTLRYFIKLVSCGCHGPVYVLKCDVKKYFDNIDHDVLIGLIVAKIGGKCRDKVEENDGLLRIIREIVSSYHSTSGHDKGVPLGNVTSQIFANIYLDVLDQYAKKKLGCRYYVRYNDDVAIVSDDREYLELTRNKIIDFVRMILHLDIPIEKTSIRKVGWGIEFLGVILLSDATLLRNKTKGKIYKNINDKNVHSYLSILKHCNSFNLCSKILAMERLRQNW